MYRGTNDSPARHYRYVDEGSGGTRDMDLLIYIYHGLTTKSFFFPAARVSSLVWRAYFLAGKSFSFQLFLFFFVFSLRFFLLRVIFSSQNGK